MIYINFVELLSLILHARFQNRKPSSSGEKILKVFAIYNHGGHLGHVTLTIYINFDKPQLTMKYISQAPVVCRVSKTSVQL